MALINWSWGTVVVAAEVDGEGKVTSARVLQPSGFYELDEASVRAVRRCTFAANSEQSSSVLRKVNITVAWEVHAAPGALGGTGRVAIGIQPRLQP